MAVKLSIADKLLLAIRLLAIAPSKLLANLVRIRVAAWARGIPSYPSFACASIKVFLSTFTPDQIQYLSPSTTQTYKTWVQRMSMKDECKKDAQVADRLRCDIESLGCEDTSLLWIGNRQKATKVILFLHGGGYIVPMLPGHLEWCWRAYVTAGVEMDSEVAVAVLQYTLCPGERYPTQLRQAVEGLDHLLSSGFKPEDIIFGGDSAGGNLTAQLISHLIQPHPTVREINLSRPLGGAFLVSPWLSRYTSDGSFSYNDCIDMLSDSIGDSSTEALLGPPKSEMEHLERAKLAFPGDMEESRWSGLAGAVSGLYITAGDQEVFRDQIATFNEKVGESNPDVKIRMEVFKGKAHDFILLEGQDEQDGKCIQAMKSWTKDVLFA